MRFQPAKCNMMLTNTVADLEGIQGVRSNSPLESNYLIFMGNFKKFCVHLGKRTGISTFEPPLEKSWIRPRNKR